MSTIKQTSFNSSSPHDRQIMRMKARIYFRKIVTSLHLQKSSKQKIAYALEVEQRLDQIEIFAKYIDQLDRAVARKLAAFHMTNPNASEYSNNLVTNQHNKQFAFVEAYYLLAWRLLEAAKHVNGFEAIAKKAKGVVTVRNRLIQHPECNGAYEWSTAIVGTSGDIKSKPMPTTGEQPRFIDRGFANNDFELHVSIYWASQDQLKA